MSDIESSVWSETAASNNAAAPNGWPEGMAPSAVNDAARETHAAIKREWNRSHTTVTSSGTSSAYTVSHTTNPAALVHGLGCSFKVHTDCGADATLKWGSLTAKTIKKMTSDGLVNLITGDLQADHHAKVEYDSDEDAFVLLNVFTVPTTVTGFLVPTGAVMPYAGTTEPTGWLFCYGQAVSRTTYADLFTAISTTYGVGDGSTTFNLPDLRGRAVAGKDDMGGVSANRLTAIGGVGGDVLGTTGGLEDHTLTSAQMPTHTHFIAAAVDAAAASVSLSTTNRMARENNSSTDTHDYSLHGVSTGASVGLSGETGSGSAHNNVQPTIILNYVIKT